MSRTPVARRTQAERTASTQARLLDATIDALVEVGWAGTSTTEVVRRAGVSRGAQVHHYRTKEDLVLAAIERLMVRRQQEFDAAFDQLPAERRTPAEAVELLWRQCFGPSFDAWLELAIAARRSPALRERFAEVEQRFASSTIDRFQLHFPDVFGDRALATVAMRLTFSVLDGAAIGRIAGVGEQELADVRNAFNLLAASFLSNLGVQS
jgi:AcrR family transcriptional regulator